MKKRFLRTVLFLILLPVLLTVAFSCVSHMRERELGMGEDQRLKPCPDTPNCVCSEDYAHPRYVPPLGFEGPPEVAWLQARQAATELGGHIEKEEFGYLWATYRTPVLRFVDDLELRLDVNSNTIHVRSASRVGYSDLGANRKRVEKLRERFEALRKP